MYLFRPHHDAIVAMAVVWLSYFLSMEMQHEIDYFHGTSLDRDFY